MSFRRPSPAFGGDTLLVLVTMLSTLATPDTLKKGDPVAESTARTHSESVLAAWPRGRGAFSRCEAAVRIPSIQGNPFEAFVWGDVDLPDGRVVRIPAFFDGDQVWKVRFTPTRPGAHRVAGFLLGEDREAARPVEFEPAGPLQFEARGTPGPGFIRRSRDEVQRFVFDDGEPYFPFGQNLGWLRRDIYAEWFKRYAAAGLNWSRVWMTHWSHQNLDWSSLDPPTSGALNLDVARAWDGIVEAAEASGVRIQLVLQHHGQYSTFVNPNWKENPWNRANGGFLDRPEDFFRDETARRLTRRKYRYIVARWGYSPAIMAWELFNEVEFTDAYVGRDLVEVWRAYESAGRVDAVVLARAAAALTKLAAQDGRTSFTLADVQSALKDIENGVFPGFDLGFGVDLVADWHREMATFLRGVDPYGHLVTTSSVPIASPVWDTMDYYQFHAYRGNMIAAVSRFPRPIASFTKPVFYGEIGDHQIKDEAKSDGRYMRTMLWVSLFSGGAGAAQMWAWDVVERLDFYPSFRAIRRFLDAADYARCPFKPVDVRFQALSAQVPDPAPAVFAARDRDRIALWIVQEKAVHADRPPAFQGRLTLPRPLDGLFRVEWWDTRTGEVASAEEKEFSSDSPPTLDTPAIHGDMAVLIVPMPRRANTPNDDGPTIRR